MVLSRFISGVIELRLRLWLASVSSVGAVIAYARGDSDTTAVVMDREAEISPKKDGEMENREKRGGGRGRGERKWCVCVEWPKVCIREMYCMELHSI